MTRVPRPAGRRRTALRRLDVGLSFGLDAAGNALPDRPLGTLAEDGPRLVLEYHPEFLARPLPVSPLRAPVQPGLLSHPNPEFDGLPGLLSDSLPDYWGRLVQDRAFAARGIPHERVTVMDRLAALGHGAMGALTFRPVVGVPDDEQSVSADLRAVAEQSERILEGSVEQLLPALRLAGGPSGGARPKLVVGLAARADGTIELISGVTPALLTGKTRTLPPGYTHYLIKFAAAADTMRFGRDVGAVEAAYAEMARRAQIDIPRTRLLTDADGGRHFAVERFDRTGIGGAGRLHMHSASGLLHASFRYPSLDYAMLLRLGQRLTASAPTALEILRRAAFNVFAHNRDDHARNFAFLMDSTGAWRLSPAYDLMYSDGINGHHSTSVANETLTPGRAQLAQLGAERDLDSSDVRVILDQVIDGIGDWSTIATEYGIRAEVRSDLERIFTAQRNA